MLAVQVMIASPMSLTIACTANFGGKRFWVDTDRPGLDGDNQAHWLLHLTPEAAAAQKNGIRPLRPAWSYR